MVIHSLYISIYTHIHTEQCLVLKSVIYNDNIIFRFYTVSFLVEDGMAAITLTGNDGYNLKICMNFLDFCFILYIQI